MSGLRLFYAGVLRRRVEGLHEYLPRTRPQRRRPRVYSREELARLFAACHDRRVRAFLLTVYGAGLRLNEACHLKVTDIESSRMLLRIEQARGRRTATRSSARGCWRNCAVITRAAVRARGCFPRAAIPADR